MFISEQKRQELLAEAENLPMHGPAATLRAAALDGLKPAKVLLREVIEIIFDYRDADPLGEVRRILWIQGLHSAPLTLLRWAAEQEREASHGLATLTTPSQP